MCDVFEDHPTIEAELRKLWPLIRQTPWLDWQLLTKRADRIAAHLPDDWGAGYANIWLGVSIENNDYVDRADALRHIPATVRFVSYEPALGPLDKLNLSGLDWIIYGGESGPGFRPHDPQWARDIRAKCRATGAAFFYKQSAAFRTEMGTTLDGRLMRDYPSPRLPPPLARPDRPGGIN
jgi:protein gp37